VATFSLYIPEMDFKFGEIIKVSMAQLDLNFNQILKQSSDLKK
jgi:hypothetical protein